MENDLSKRLMEFFSLDRKVIMGDYDSWLYSYYRKLFSDQREARGFLDWCNHLAHLCSAKDGELLDAGCGFGITCFGFAASDCAPRRVVGLDPSEGKISTMTKIADFLNVGEDGVEPSLGDAMALEFDDESFDVVFVKDVASHVRDRELFFREISRVLKPGGRLLLTDENNGLNLTGLSTRRKLWLQNEAGPLPDATWMAKPYRDQRRDMIAEWCPHLPEESIDELADESKGMWGDELKNAVENYKPGEVFVFVNTADFDYRHPVSGEYMEYPFNPFILAKEIPAYGFSKASYIRPCFATGHPLKKMAGSIISALHPLSAIIQPSLYILATK